MELIISVSENDSQMRKSMSCLIRFEFEEDRLLCQIRFQENEAVVGGRRLTQAL